MPVGARAPPREAGVTASSSTGGGGAQLMLGHPVSTWIGVWAEEREQLASPQPETKGTPVYLKGERRRWREEAL